MLNILVTLSTHRITILIFVASLQLKNEIGERQDSFRRLGRACEGMFIADTETGRTHLGFFLDTV